MHFPRLSGRWYSLVELRLAGDIWLGSVSKIWLVPFCLGTVWTSIHFGALWSLEKTVAQQEIGLSAKYSAVRDFEHGRDSEGSDKSGWMSLFRVIRSPGSQDDAFKRVLQTAELHHVSVIEAGYRATKVPIPGVVQTIMQIPVKGSYPDIRSWFDDVLLKTPALSLDDISFKRETVGNGQIEAHLRFTLTTLPISDGAPAKNVKASS